MPEYRFDPAALQQQRTGFRRWGPRVAGALGAALSTYLLDQAMGQFGMEYFYNTVPWVGARTLIDLASIYPVFAGVRNMAEQAMIRREERLYHDDLNRRHALDMEMIDRVRNANTVNRLIGRRPGRLPNPLLPPRYPPQRGL